jgi:hypothetical protein
MAEIPRRLVANLELTVQIYSVEYYIAIPIDDNIVVMLLHVRNRKCAASKNEFASEVVWRIPLTIRAARLDCV